ncbi:MAG: DUF1059 domain-containing protein [Nitrospirota bacterium]
MAETSTKGRTRLLRCRDAGMMGPFCDYIAEGETDEEVLRLARIHAKTHNEREITEEELKGWRTKISDKEQG